MNKSRLVLAAALLSLAALALPLLASTANFRANCAAGIPTNCVFDPSRTPALQTPTSCAPSTVNSYFWDFDTVNSGEEEFTTNLLIGYTYQGQYCQYVDLVVFCNGGQPSAYKRHCFCNYLGIGGCIIPGTGWSP